MISLFSTGNRLPTGLTLWHITGIVAACSLAYAFGLNGPLLFDDTPNLTANVLAAIGGDRFDDWRTAALSSNSGWLYRPVAMATFAFNYVLAGQWSPAGLKVLNLLIHLLVGACVYCFCWLALGSPALKSYATSVSRRRSIALLGAGLWVLHPLHVSTVLYAVQRMAQLSALFTVMGLIVFCCYRLRWAERGASLGAILTAGLWLLLLGLLAVLSKENGLLLLALIPIVEVTLFRGVWAGATSKRLLLASWAVLIVPTVLIAITLVYQPSLVMARYGGREFTLEQRLLTQPRVLWHYVSWLVWPDIKAMGLHHDDIPLSTGSLQPLTTLTAIVAWLGVLVAAWLARQRCPGLLFAVLFFLGAHSMESSFVPLEMVYEHRNYLPSVGLALAVALLLARLLGVFTAPLRVLASAGILGVLFVLLLMRSAAWSDGLHLARVNVANHPQSPRANFFYGQMLYDEVLRREELALTQAQVQNRVLAARQHFLTMHTLSPRDFAALVMLYKIDALYFAAMPDAPDWLGELQKLAQLRRVQASDLTALEALVAFTEGRDGRAGHERIVTLITSLQARYPRRTTLALLHYRLLAADPEVTRAQRLASLDTLGAAGYPHRAQHHLQTDKAAAFEEIRGWVGADKHRRALSNMRAVFAN